jgi:hypothetical protein
MVRANNEAADKLSKLESTRASIPHGVFVYDLIKPSIEEQEKPVAEQPSTNQLVATISTTTTDWREPFIRYLTSAEVLRIKPRCNASYGVASIMYWLRGTLCAKIGMRNYCKNMCLTNTD